MPSCPNCKTKMEQPQRILTVPGDLNRQLGYVEHRIALYECPVCQLKFPVGVGCTELRIIKASEWETLRKKATDKESLQARIQELESEVQRLNEKLVLEGLISRQERLASEVAHLQDIKSSLLNEVRAAQGSVAE